MVYDTLKQSEEDSGLINTPPEPLSVSAALSLVKTALESITLSIIGEISDLSDNPRYKAVYFTLADEGAALPCLMWRSSFDRLGIQLKSGMKVEVRGRFSLYSAKGRMQFDVRELTLAGEGQLRAQVAALAAKLRLEGLMDDARKLPLPYLPQHIALITSPRGKAVHDVLRTMRRRYPLGRIMLYGVGVEGKEAARNMGEALKAAEHSEAELILLVRGGGSYEDLMPFNDETLARTIAGLSKPVITGIGHEPDTSIADMVASLRASTPTAAAEAAAPDIQELASHLTTSQGALAGALQRYLERTRHEVEGLQRSSAFSEQRYQIAEQLLNLEQTALRLDTAIPTGLKAAREGMDQTRQRLATCMGTLLGKHTDSLTREQQALVRIGAGFTARQTAQLGTAAASLESLSPLAVLSRGYSLSYHSEGSIVRSVTEVETGDVITVQLADGVLDTQVLSKQHLSKETA